MSAVPLTTFPSHANSFCDSSEDAQARRQDELLALITGALTKPNRLTRCEPSTYPNTTIATNAIFDSVNKVEAACATLTKEYAAFDELMETMAADERSAVLMKEWTRDIAETERRLRLGHRTAIRNVKKVLGAELDESEEEGQSEEGLNMQLLQGLQYVERGVKRMVKGVPVDVQMEE